MKKSTPEELISKMIELDKKKKEIDTEILNSGLVPKEFKDFVINNNLKMKEEDNEYQRYLDENEGKKVISYDPQTFKPIFEQ